MRTGFPFVQPETLLRISGMLWLIAGLTLMSLALFFIFSAGANSLAILLSGLAGGILLYYLVFVYISTKHSLKILYKGNTPRFFLSFFSVRGWLIMVLIIGSGILLGNSGLISEVLLKTFLLILGIPLIISSFQYFSTAGRFSSLSRNLTNAPVKVPGKQRFMISIRLIAAMLIMVPVILTITYRSIRLYSEPKCYGIDRISELPSCEAAIVLGTSQYLSEGRTNLYFQYRMQAAAELYDSGKINYIIVSGDNSHISYNEPVAMKKALLKFGIPDSVIYLDYAGFRTFDSMIRAFEIFGQNKIIVVSQAFHNHRAIYIARHNGIEAYGFDAPDVDPYIGFKTQIREYFARAKVLLDLYILQTTPRYLGPQVLLGEKQIH